MPSGVPPLVTARLGRPIEIPGIDADHSGQAGAGGRRGKSRHPGAGTLPRHPAAEAITAWPSRSWATLAAPAALLTLQDIGAGRRMWGVAAQI